MTAKSVLCQKVHFLWASVRVSRIADYRQLGTWWGTQSVFSKQQIIDTNSVTDSIQIQLSLSPLPISSRLCSCTQCCLYIISVYPLPYVSIIGGLMLSDVWLVPLSPLYLTTLSSPGYNWGSRSLLRSSMSTHHTWSPPSQCYQAPSAHHHRQQTSGFCGERGDAATLMTINWLVFASSRRGPLAGVSRVYHV